VRLYSCLYVDEVWTDCQEKMAICEESIMVRLPRPLQLQWWVLVPHTMKFLCKCDALFVHLILLDILRMKSVLWAKRKWPHLCPESHGRPLHPFGRWVFVPATQWQNSCGSDALFVWLTLYHTLRYTTDEVCIDS
jgi:hypothetical protein